jgi:hypothetical protein
VRELLPTTNFFGQIKMFKKLLFVTALLLLCMLAVALKTEQTKESEKLSAAGAKAHPWAVSY